MNVDSQICKVCPKCQKDYSGNPHWKSNLKKHLARKNPCDRDPRQVEYNREKPKKSAIRFTKDVYDYIHWLNWVRSHCQDPLFR